MDSRVRGNDGTRRAKFMVITIVGRLFLVARGLVPRSWCCVRKIVCGWFPRPTSPVALVRAGRARNLLSPVDACHFPSPRSIQGEG